MEKDGVGPDDIEVIKKLRRYIIAKGYRVMYLHQAEILEGSVRNTGIHAAGIIIAPKDLTELIPVATAKDSDLWVTQIEGNIIEDAGVIKMDFLGLKTLTIIKDALELINKIMEWRSTLINFLLMMIKLLNYTNTAIRSERFQFESPGMQKYLRELKPDRLDDLIAMNALYRPGPCVHSKLY
jgi:DNA polymerase-3 subunit alpha